MRTKLAGLGLVAGVVLVASGCGDGGTGGADGTTGAASRPHDSQQEYDVAADRNATPAEIVEAGTPVAVATSGDRSLVTYVVQSDDDEGPQQGAWRLYDGDGARVADGRFPQVLEQGAQAGVRTVDDGFLIESYTRPRLVHVAVDGTATPVRQRREVRATAAGDLLVEPADDGGQAFYHQADATAYRLGRVPSDNPQSVVLDDAGTVHVLLPWRDRGPVEVASSPGGLGPWTRTRLPLAGADYPLIDLVATGGRVLLPVARGRGEYPEVNAVLARPAGTQGDWSSTPLSGVSLGRTLDPTLATLTDGRLVVSGDGSRPWVQTDDGFAQVSLPRGADEGRVQVVGDRLYTVAGPARDLFATRDLGRTWTRVPR